MACRAIEPNNFDTAINAPRDPDRQISRSIIGVVLVEKAKYGIVVALFEGLRKEPREGTPDAVGDPAILLGADRTVFEVLDNIAIAGGVILRNAQQHDQPERGANQTDEKNERQHQIDRGPKTPASAQRFLNGRDRKFPVHGTTSAGCGTRSSGCVL